MNIFNTMKSMEVNYTKTDKEICKYILRHFDTVVRDSLTDTASVSGFSAASLTRYAKKLGFTGYDELKYQLQRDTISETTENSEKSLPDQYANLFREIERRYPVSEIKPLASLLYHADRIYVTGFHNSSTSATLFNYRLEELRYTTSHLPYDEAFKLDAFTRKEDVVIIFSVHSVSYRDVVKQMRAMGSECPKIVLFCMDPKHVIRSKADMSFVLPDEHTIGYDHYLDPSITFSYFTNKVFHELKAKD